MNQRDVERRNQGLGLKTKWRFCEHCQRIWTFDHQNSDHPVVHFAFAEKLPEELCPTCEEEIMSKGFEVAYKGNE